MGADKRRVDDEDRAKRDPHLREGRPHAGSGRDPKNLLKKSSGGGERGKEALRRDIGEGGLVE